MKIKRLEFIRISLIAGIYLQIPFLDACKPNSKDIKPLSKDDYNTLNEVQKILFPSVDDSPSAESIKSINFTLKILNDPLYDSGQKQYLIKGIKWIDETAQEDHKKNFTQLSDSAQTKLIKKISSLDWGQSWLSFNLTIIFEALLSDPIYGSNPNKSGWNWLEHKSGYPRANFSLMYPQILKTIRKKEI